MSFLVFLVALSPSCSLSADFVSFCSLMSSVLSEGSDRAQKLSTLHSWWWSSRCQVSRGQVLRGARHSSASTVEHCGHLVKVSLSDELKKEKRSLWLTIGLRATRVPLVVVSGIAMLLDCTHFCLNFVISQFLAQDFTHEQNPYFLKFQGNNFIWHNPRLAWLLDR